MNNTDTKLSPYSQKIWLKSYDAHVKPKIDLEYFSVAEMMKRTVKKYPNSLCYDFQGSCATFKEAEMKINSFANFLVENGVKKGERVVINLPNLPQFIVALFGTFFAGCAASGMNFLLSPNEINYQLKYLLSFINSAVYSGDVIFMSMPAASSKPALTFVLGIISKFQW